MVNRQLEVIPERHPDSMEGARGVVVTDLDGTLLRGNSLKWILKAGLKRLLRSGRLSSFLAVLGLGGLCMMRIVSHETMKYGALRLFGDDPKLMDEMRRMGHEMRRESVSRLLAEAAAAGDEILLATAASESYVPYVWDGDYIASPFGGPDLKGERKLQRLRERVAARNQRVKAFLTDHYDDLATAEWVADNGGKVYLVNPSQKTIERFDESGVPYTLMT